MNWSLIPGSICIISFFLPVVVIIYNRFYKHRSLAALLIYYVMMALYLLMFEKLIPVPKSVRINYGVLTNYLDVPLMLTTLLFFCPNRPKQRVINILTISFIAYEVIITCIHGFKPVSIVYIMGPGLLLILVYSFYLFVRQVKFSIMHGKNYGRMIMLASIFFVYACYGFIYYFFYIIDTPDKNDTFLLYFIASSIGSITMTIGLQLMSKRMKELQSLKITRKELAVFFGHQ